MLSRGEIIMPYIRDENDQDIYIPSKYAKEELPTWDEIYNQFFLEKVGFYDPRNEEHQIPDMYWKLPHRKMLLGWMANQFNKMLLEDREHTAKVKDAINELGVLKQSTSIVHDIRFILVEYSDDPETAGVNFLRAINASDRNTIILPEIYTLEIPSTNERSIFASDLPSFNMRDFNDLIFLGMMISYGDTETSKTDFAILNDPALDTLLGLKDDHLAISLVPNDDGDDDSGVHLCPQLNIHYWDIIKVLIADVVNYFEGEFVGWKNPDGTLIEGGFDDFKPGCGKAAGIDAGL